EQEDLLGRSVFDHVHPEELASFLDQINNSATPLAYRYRDARGEWRWFESIGKTFQQTSNAARTFIFSRDITSRKRVEEAVRASEAKYRSLIENLEQGIFLKDRDLRFVAVNR